MIDHIAAVRNLLAGLELGTPRRSGALTLIPLRGALAAPDYLLASHAFVGGLLHIEELGGASVPQIAAINRSELPVLFVDGEHLEGAKQSRVMNHSALIAPRRETVLPVSCVEQGRWHYGSRSDFVPSQSPLGERASSRRLRRSRDPR